MAQPPIPLSAKPRTLIQRFADRLATRLQRLLAPTDDYTVARDLSTPMRDGVVLLSDVYTPNAACIGTLLMRSPYGFGSGGTSEPMRREVEDGADTAAWCGSNRGSTGALGASSRI